MWKILPICALLFAAHLGANDTYRNLPCKTPDLAPSCIRIHGRLRQGNGNPSTRLWHIGTNHVYGIYSNKYGFEHDDRTLDNEGPELPSNLRNLHYTKYPDMGIRETFADFDVCPLEHHIKGHMQAACIASAEHIVSPDD